MFPQVGLHIRPFRCAQQGQAYSASLNVIPVLAVIQETYPVPMFRDICEPVTAYLILGLLPAGVPMCRALQGAERNFVRCFIRNHIDRKAHLKQLVRFIPAHLSSKVNSPIMVIEDDVLSDLRLMNLPAEP
ncbi:hypothetical protein D3C72_457420 [compost metagenome]